MNLATLLRSLVAGLLFAGAAALAQPALPQENIPADLPADLRGPLANLYSSDAATRATAAQALREFRVVALRPAAPYLTGMLADDAALKIAVPHNPFGGIPTSPGEEAARTLAKLGKEALPALTGALADERPHARQSAAVGLGETGLEEAAPALLKALESETRVPVARAIVDALGHIQAPAAIGPLLLALEDTEWELRKSAAQALCAQLSNDPRMVTPLLAFLQDARKQPAEFAVIGTVEDKLGDLTGIHGADQDTEWARWAQAQAR